MENLIEDPEFIRYENLIAKLLSLKRELTQEDFDWLSSDDRISRFGFQDRQLHYFMFGVDWSYIYEIKPVKRITTYDIFRATATREPKKRLNEFNQAYCALGDLFDGVLNTSDRLKDGKTKILDRLTRGLKQLGFHKSTSSKGLNELFKRIFEKLAQDHDTEDLDIIRPQDKQKQRSEVYLAIFERFLPAYDFSKRYKQKYGLQIGKVKIDEYCILHTFLKHVPPYKVYYEVLPSSNQQKIKNGLGEQEPVTAIQKTDGSRLVLSKDGVFYLPYFSAIQDDYISYINDGGRLSLQEAVDNFHRLLNKLVPILEIKCNFESSTNIIYLDRELYGVQIVQQAKPEIIIGSLYPLNGEHQDSDGVKKITQKAYNAIINKGDIPSDFKIEQVQDSL